MYLKWNSFFPTTYLGASPYAYMYMHQNEIFIRFSYFGLHCKAPLAHYVYSISFVRYFSVTKKKKKIDLGDFSRIFHIVNTCH